MDNNRERRHESPWQPIKKKWPAMDDARHVQNPKMQLRRHDFCPGRRRRGKVFRRPMRILSQRLRVPPSGAETDDAPTDRLKPGMKTPGGAFKVPRLLIASRKFPWKCRAGVRGGVQVERDGPRDAADRRQYWPGICTIIRLLCATSTKGERLSSAQLLN